MHGEREESPGADTPAPGRRRRPRYRGTHPRRFAERYKELAPEKYPEIAAHVRAQGRTPAGTHVPVLVPEVLAALDPRPGEVVADLTLGHGGHALALWPRIQPGGRLYGLDLDGAVLARTRDRLAAAGAEITVEESNFAGLGSFLRRHDLDGCDVLFADLGVSSLQIDDPARGFSYKHDGPLDMRMGESRRRTAAELLATLSAGELATALAELADEPQAAAIAAAVVAARARAPLQSTRDLTRLVLAAKGISPRVLGAARRADPDLLHPAARTFQALRMLVNEERGNLAALLREAPHCLKPGGRIGIVSFHSGEDRLVAEAFAAGRAAGFYAAIAAAAIRPGPAEHRANPRSSSARFRWARRGDAGTVA